MHAPARPRLIDPDVLLLAYRSGIFPMADDRDDPEVFWIEPKMRAVIPLNGFHLSKSLARTLRRDRFTVTCDMAFSQVVEACAGPRIGETDSSWISHSIQASYENLHRLGHAHSIECWQEGPDGDRQLVGGLYGVGFARVFCGESMFARSTDASKVAMAWLVAALRTAGAEVLDCQFQTDHLASLGAVEIAQEEYVALLERAQRPYSEADAPLSLPDAFLALLDEAADAGFASSPGKRIAQSLTQTS